MSAISESLLPLRVVDLLITACNLLEGEAPEFAPIGQLQGLLATIVMASARRLRGLQRVDSESKQVYTQGWVQSVRDCDEADIVQAQTPPLGPSISALYAQCLNVFRLVCQKNNRLNIPLRAKISPELMKDEYARLHLWGEGLPIDILDRALGPADYLKQKIEHFLEQIGRLLLRGLCPQHNSSADHPNVSALQSMLDDRIRREIKSGQLTTKQEISDESSDSEDEPNDIPSDIGFQTRCLLELSSTIKSCIDHAEKEQPCGVVAAQFSVSGPAKYYVQIVHDKYKTAPIQLVERLGEANWQRHNRLRRINQGHEMLEEDVTATIKPKSVFHDSGIGTTEGSVTQYAGTVQSHSSFISSNATGEVTGLRVPSAPNEMKYGKPFECHFCGQVQQNISNRVQWKLHVFADLRPYICTHEICGDYLSQFSSRTAWADHEFSQHRFQANWQCMICSQAFLERSACKQHIQQAHGADVANPSAAANSLMTFRAQERPIEEEVCFLCRQKPATTKRAFRNHVARHMEEIALMALPVTDNDSDDDASVDTEDSQATAQRSLAEGHRQSALDARSSAETERASNLLREYGIEPAGLSSTQFESFKRQPLPAQVKSIQVYYKNMSSPMPSNYMAKDHQKSQEGFDQSQDRSKPRVQILHPKIDSYDVSYEKQQETLTKLDKHGIDVTQLSRPQLEFYCRQQPDVEKSIALYLKSQDKHKQGFPELDRARGRLQTDINPLPQALYPGESPIVETQWASLPPPPAATEYPLQHPIRPSAPQRKQMVMPDRMRWMYQDPQGHEQGPWSGLEMHDWYKAGFFSPELPVKQLGSDYEPLARLIRWIGNSREPFLVPQIGIPHEVPSASLGAAGPPPNIQDPPSWRAFTSSPIVTNSEANKQEIIRKQIMLDEGDVLQADIDGMNVEQLHSKLWHARQAWIPTTDVSQEALPSAGIDKNIKSYYSRFPRTPDEADIKPDPQMYFDDLPTKKDSPLSTFSTFHPPLAVNPVEIPELSHATPSLLGDYWSEQAEEEYSASLMKHTYSDDKPCQACQQQGHNYNYCFWKRGEKAAAKSTTEPIPSPQPTGYVQKTSKDISEGERDEGNDGLLASKEISKAQQGSERPDQSEQGVAKIVGPFWCKEADCAALPSFENLADLVLHQNDVHVLKLRPREPTPPADHLSIDQAPLSESLVADISTMQTPEPKPAEEKLFEYEQDIGMTSESWKDKAAFDRESWASDLPRNSSFEQKEGGRHLRKTRPCDACRARKSKCVIVEGQTVCKACAIHPQKCTYNEDPRPKKGRFNIVRQKDGAKNRSAKMATENKSVTELVEVRQDSDLNQDPEKASEVLPEDQSEIAGEESGAYGQRDDEFVMREQSRQRGERPRYLEESDEEIIIRERSRERDRPIYRDDEGEKIIILRSEPSPVMPDECEDEDITAPNEAMTQSRQRRHDPPQYQTPSDEGVRRMQKDEIGGSEPKQCQNCLTYYTRKWRRGPNGPDTLCDDCGLRYAEAEKSPEKGRCRSCNRIESIVWRRGPDGAKTLCNACGLQYAKLTRKMANKTT